MNPQVQEHTFSIADAPQLLQVNDQVAEQHLALKRQFMELVRSKVQEFLTLAGEESPELVAEFEEKLNGFSAAEQEHMMSIPAFLGQVFRNKARSAADKIRFWLEIIDRHIALRDRDFSHLEYPAFWTLDGAAFMRKQEDGDHVVFENPKLYDKIILDFFSAVNATLGSEDYLSIDNEHEVQDYSFEEAEELMDFLDQCLEPIHPSIESLLTNFSHVVHFRKSPVQSTSSSTNGGFIGRILICNAQLYQPELFAEAMVHEATHGVLFMINELNQWMPGTKEHNATHHHIPSPWTGNLLTPRNLFQACFVWYGLFEFFQSHFNLYPNTKVIRDRMELIQKGFRNLPLETLLPERFPETASAIEFMKTRVTGFQFA